MKADSFTYTSIGGRSENQDALGEVLSENGGLFVVADGLGGHQAGRLAADCIVQQLCGAWDGAVRETAESLAAKIEAANEAVLAVQREKSLTTKSTVVALSVQGKEAVWAHTGDSRLYFLRGSRIETVTEDHSVAYKKYKAGEITRDEIATDEDQSSLLRSLGSPRRWEPDVQTRENLEEGDAFLLCSDGMWEYLRDEEILVDRLKARSARDWAELLLLRAVARIRPGNDNLSLITVILGPESKA